MSPRGLRAGLKRLEKKIKLIEPADHVCRFRVEPALAKALRDDHLRADKLERDFNSSAEWFEAIRLRERNVERHNQSPARQTTGKPARTTTASILYASGGSLTNAEDAEEAQLTARVAAYHCRRSRPGAMRRTLAAKFYPKSLSLRNSVIA
jgi:hypothetical protein